jgi:hypothetical protein
MKLFNYSLFFGSKIDMKRTSWSVRNCVTAAYTNNHIADRQLVRPLSLVPVSNALTVEDILYVQNRKTGGRLGSQDDFY